MKKQGLQSWIDALGTNSGAWIYSKTDRQPHYDGDIGVDISRRSPSYDWYEAAFDFFKSKAVADTSVVPEEKKLRPPKEKAPSSLLNPSVGDLVRGDILV